MIKDYIIIVIRILVDLLSIAIIARIIMSWIRVDWSNKVARFLVEVTDPLLQPAKKIIPRIGMLDISPIIVLIGLDVVKYAAVTLVASL